MKTMGIYNQSFAPVDWKNKLHPIAYIHALFTQQKGNAPGQLKVPEKTNFKEQPPTYANAVHCSGWTATYD